MLTNGVQMLNSYFIVFSIVRFSISYPFAYSFSTDSFAMWLRNEVLKPKYRRARRCLIFTMCVWALNTMSLREEERREQISATTHPSEKDLF